MVTCRVQKSRSTLPSRAQPILTGALTHYQNCFRKLNDVNQMRFSMRYLNAQDLYDTHIIFELLACLTPGFQGHENVFSKLEISAGFANKLRNQFRGLGRSQALLRLRCVFCRSFRDLFGLKNMVSSSNSKFFLHNEKGIGLVK